MISIKRFLDREPPVTAKESDSPKVPQAVARIVTPDGPLAEYRSLLLTVGDCAERAVPSLGTKLKQKISGHGRQISCPSVTETTLKSVNLEVRADLEKWADQAMELQSEHERALKEIIGVVATAAETIGKRDKKYAAEIGAMAQRLRSLADHADMGAVRRSIIESAGAFQTCIAKMAEEGRQALTQITAQAEQYRARLEETELISVLDALTGITNRRGLERNVTYRMEGKHLFSLILIDLDRFKEINDQYGHVAGDDLLRQFAAELKTLFSPGDLVTRLGGDEFVAVVAGGRAEAEDRADSIRTWALGNYNIWVGDARQEHHLRASLGVAVWDMQESLDNLLARADSQMYKAKAESRDNPSRQADATASRPAPPGRRSGVLAS